MDPSPQILTPPPSAGTGSGDEATAWETAPEPNLPPLTATSAPGAGLQASFALPSLALRQVVAGRYRILDFVARGGMGEVYEALDLDLNERLALKVLAPDLAEGEESLARFKRELSLARKVTHPNVCRTYDFFQAPDGFGGKLACLSMELLEGETLARRLGREGRLEPEVARAFALQIASALEAAHAVGVVHRDLKPSNIMLVKGSSGEASLRVVITDFGLAFSQGGHDHGGNRFLGTPAYMAPEQVEYKPATLRTDIYAFGLVLFEMLTGRAAFLGSTPISAATRRLKEPPPHASLVAPGLDPFWDAVLAKCLALDPEDRYASATELLAVLEPEAARFSLSMAPAQPRRWVRGLVVAAGVTCLVSVGGYGAFNLSKGRVPWALPVKGRPSIAVVGLKCIGPSDGAWRSTAISEMLATELGLDAKIRIIPGEDVVRLVLGRGAGIADITEKENLELARRSLGTEYLLTGSVKELEGEGQLRLDVSLWDTGKKEVLFTAKVDEKREQLATMAAAMGRQIRFRLGVPEGGGAGQGLATYSKIPGAMQQYIQALEKMRAFDARGAKVHLERAVASDPEFALAHALLSEVHYMMGFQKLARESADLALKYSANIATLDQLRIKGQHGRVHEQWNEALVAFRTLFTLSPGLREGLDLLQCAEVAGDLQMEKSSLLLLEGRIKDWPDDIRLDYLKARLARAKGDWTLQREAAQASIQKAKKSGLRDLEALSRLHLGLAFQAQGKHSEAVGEYTGALALFEGLGEPEGICRCLHYLSANAVFKGDWDRAADYCSKGILKAREFGLKGIEAGIMENLKWAQVAKGNPQEAWAIHENQRRLDQEIGASIREAPRELDSVALLSQLGRNREAMAHYDVAVGIIRATHEEGGWPDHFALVAKPLEQGGRLEEAFANLQPLVAHRDPTRGPRTDLQTSLSMAGILRAKGKGGEAKVILEEVHTRAKALGRSEDLSLATLEMAKLALDVEDWQTAESMALDSQKRFGMDGNRLGAAEAGLLVSRALQKQGKWQGAQQFMAEIPKWVSPNACPDIRWGMDLLQAESLAATKSATSLQMARRLAEKVGREAGISGNFVLEVESRLLLGALDLQDPSRRRAGRKAMETLKQEVVAKGYGLYVNKLQNLIGKSI